MMARGATLGVEMGLLDSMDDPRTMGLLSLGMGLLNSRGNFGQALGQAGPQALQAVRQVQEDRQKKAQREQAQQMQALQMQQAQAAMAQQQAQQQRQAAIEGAYRGALRSPEQMAMAGGGGPSVANAAAIPNTMPQIDQSALIRNLMQADPMAAYQMLQPKPEDMKVVGDALVGVTGGKARELYRAPQKPAALPSAIQEYQFAQGQGYQGTFEQFQTGLKKAGATNIGMPKIDIKMGESVAGQIGPMAKDSRIQVQGAVGMFDSADRIQKALDSGKVSAGPLTTQIQTVKQLIQKVGGGNDEGIRQTRQVIKGLAQMSVEARKELAGQGQVTESEAAAVAKAESGDINDLTTGELQDLVTLTKRAAHMRAKSHQGIIESMTANEATRGVVPFYQVPGMDRLLKHSPQLPQIGGGSAVDAALQKYGPK
jgi:hypothetical protein